MSWTLPRGKYGPPLCYRPTSTTVSCYSRISSTIRRRPPQGPPLLHPLGPRGNPTILNKTTLNLTCLWMTVTTRARNTPSCPRPRNLVSSLSAKDVATSRVTWATTSQVTQGTRAGPAQHRSPRITRGQQRALSRRCPGSSPKVNMTMMTQQVKPIPMRGPTTHRTGPTRLCKGGNDHEVPEDKGWWFGPSRSLDPSVPLVLLGPKPAFWNREQNLTATRIHLWLGATPPYSYTTTKPLCVYRGTMGTSGKGPTAVSSVWLWHMTTPRRGMFTCL